MAPSPAPPRRVLLNWLWLFTAQVLVRLVALGYKVFLARALGVAGYGLYAWVVTTVMVFTLLVEAGMNRLLIRDVARQPERGPGLMGAVARVRLVFAAVAFVAMLGVFLVVPTQDGQLLGLAIVGITLFIGAGSLTFDAGFYAAEEARFSGVAQVIVTVTAALLGVAAVLLHLGLPGLFAGVVASQLLQAAYLYFRLQDVHLRPDWDAILPWRPLLRDALPYALLGALNVLYFRIDTVMLQPLRGSEETGIYTAAFKLLEVMLFVPGTLAAVILPRMARYHQEDTDRLRASHLRLTRLLFGVGLPVSAALWLFSPWIIATLYGPEYAAATPVLRVLAGAFLFYCLQTPNATLVLSGSVLAPVVWLSVGTTLFNVVLNVVFIPAYGARAAAATTVASDALSWIVFTAFIHWRVTSLRGWGGAMLRPACAGAAAGLAYWLCHGAERITPVQGALIACSVYVVCSLLAGVVTRADVALLRRPPEQAAAWDDPVDLA